MSIEINPRIVWVDKLRTPQAMENVANKISEATVLTYDIETNAREFDHPDFTLYLISIDIDDWNFVFGPSEKSIRMGSVLLGMSSKTKVGHNSIKFDAFGLEQIEPSACKTLKYESEDTMLMDYLLNENVKHSLENACGRWIDAPEWKGMVTWDWHDTPAEEIPWETAVEYCAKDTHATRKLYDQLWWQIEADEGLRRVYEDVLKPGMVAFKIIERTGVPVDREYCERAIREYIDPEIEKALASMRAVNPTFNPNSNPQLGKVLFEQLGATPVEWTSGGKKGTPQPSTGETTLKTLIERYGETSVIGSFCKSLLDYREHSKIKSTYLLPFPKQCDEQGRLHCEYGLTSTVSGRTNCFAPNYENVPRDPRARKMIAAPEGFTLLQADYSQLELRIGALAANERNMLAAFERNEDLHKKLAQYITEREEITKEERTSAKIAGFGFLYGADEQTFIEYAFKNYGVRFTFDEAKRIRDRFFEMYPDLDAWYQAVAKELKETEQVRSMTGQIRRFPGYNKAPFFIKLEMLRQAVNFKVQNPAAHLGIVGCSMLVTAFNTIRVPATQVVGFVHDAVHIITPTEEVEATALTMKRIMEKQVPEFLQQGGVCISVPLVADIETGPSWGELTKMTFTTGELLSA